MFINYIALLIIPLIIFIIILNGLVDKNNVFDDFIKGVNEGLKIVMELFPILLAFFVAIGLLSNCGIIEFVSNKLRAFFSLIRIPGELIPLIIIRPISGSGAIAFAIDLMIKYGVDSKIGLMASIIIGSTETTFYVYTLYLGRLKIKHTRGIIIASICADIVGIVTSVFICNLML